MKRLLVIRASLISLFYLVLTTMPVFAYRHVNEDFCDGHYGPGCPSGPAHPDFVCGSVAALMAIFVLRFTIFGVAPSRISNFFGPPRKDPETDWDFGILVFGVAFTLFLTYMSIRLFLGGEDTVTGRYLMSLVLIGVGSWGALASIAKWLSLIRIGTGSESVEEKSLRARGITRLSSYQLRKDEFFENWYELTWIPFGAISMLVLGVWVLFKGTG